MVKKMLIEMDKSQFQLYKENISSLLKFMVENGYTSKPYPKIILNDKPQKEKVLISTGYYDPENKTVVIFTNGRAIKDCLRSAAHEFIHHKQNIEGRLGNGAYEGQRITDDKKLIMLEAESFLKGNIGFRKWTESIKR